MAGIISLKKGVEIEYACKKYTHKTGIPEEIHKKIYGDTGNNDAEKKKNYAIRLKKHKYAPEKMESEKDVKTDGDKTASK